MRRLLVSLLLVGSVLGTSALPALADPASNGPTLAYDLSDNDAPPAVSNGAFNVIVNVLPEGTAGFVRVVALPPADSSATRLLCKYQAVDTAKSRVECSFKFTATGTWAIRAQYSTDPSVPVSAIANTNLRVGF